MLRSDGSEQCSLELGLPGEIDRSGQDTGRFLRAVEAAPLLGEDEVPSKLSAADESFGLGQLHHQL